MIGRPPLATLLASLVAHGGAVALLFFLVSGESHPGVLFVDMAAVAERETPVAPLEPRPGPGGGAAVASSQASRRTRPESARSAAARSTAAPSAATSPAPAPPPAAAPARQPEPEPAREPATAPIPVEPPAAPEPAIAIVPAREAAPDVVARSQSSEASADARPSPGPAGAGRGGAGDPGGTARTTPGGGPGGQGAAGAGVSSGGSPSGAPGAEYGSYLAGVRRRFLEALKYPPPARSRGLTGTVQLDVFIKPDGVIGSVSVASSSSHPLLDEAALEAMRGLPPQPFPEGLKPRALRVRLPVVFDLQ
jgi:periplasmic protein TonB